MSQPVYIEQGATMHSNEASMASGNGSNGTSTPPIVAPQVIEEPMMGLFPSSPDHLQLHYLVTKGFSLMHCNIIGMFKVL